MNDGQESRPGIARVVRRVSTLMAESGAVASGQLLVGHDTHSASQAAVRFAADLASRLGAHLHVVHVVELADIPVDPDSPDWQRAEYRELKELHDDAKRLVAGTGIDWTYHACNGDPVELLAGIAIEYDVLFIAVGATEHNLYRRLTEGGSVSGKLLRQQGKPVLVVPEPHPES